MAVQVEAAARALVQVSSYFETGTANLNAHLRFDSEPESDSEASSLTSIASARARANDRGHRGPGVLNRESDSESLRLAAHLPYY